MYYGTRRLVLAALAAMALGIFLHFLHGWFPNGITALFAPVRESLWEHGKIIFWPYLLAALWLNRGRPGGIRPWLLTLSGMVGATLFLAYGYHILLGGDTLWVDIALYLLVMAAGFWLAGRSSGPFSGPLWALTIPATVLWGLLFLLFTLWPPLGPLFDDLSQAMARLFMTC